MAAHLLGLDSVSEYAGILQGGHVRMADFAIKSAIFRALGGSWARTQARRWAGPPSKWQSC